MLKQGEFVMIKSIYILLMLILIPSLLLPRQLKLITSQVLNLGDVYEDTIAVGTIKFANAGDKPLEIMNIRTSCGCTAAELEKRVYEPGEEGEVIVRFNTRNFSGLVRKSVSIYVKDATPSNVKVTVQANIRRKLEIEPRFVNFQNIQMDQTLHLRKVQVINNWDQPFYINEVKSDIKILDISPKKFKIAPGTSQDIELKFSSMEEGKSVGYLVINIDKPTQMVKRIPIYINVVR